VRKGSAGGREEETGLQSIAEDKGRRQRGEKTASAGRKERGKKVNQLGEGHPLGTESAERPRLKGTFFFGRYRIRRDLKGGTALAIAFPSPRANSLAKVGRRRD